MIFVKILFIPEMIEILEQISDLSKSNKNLIYIRWNLYMKKDVFIQDYNILMKIKATILQLIQLHDEVNEKNEEHKYFTIFILEY